MAPRAKRIWNTDVSSAPVSVRHRTSAATSTRSSSEGACEFRACCVEIAHVSCPHERIFVDLSSPREYSVGERAANHRFWSTSAIVADGSAQMKLAILARQSKLFTR
jgi:hypothetical protein